MLFYERHDPLKQLVAGAVTLRVVDRLQPHDIDVGDDQQAGGPVAAIQLAIEVRQARRTGAGSGQGVGLGDRELVCERLAVDEGVTPLARSLLAVLGRGTAVLGRLRQLLVGQRAQLLGVPALFGGVHETRGAGGERGRPVLLLTGAVAL